MRTSPGAKWVPAFAALAQGTRLQILDRLALAGPEGLTAGEIARQVRSPPSTLSFHLKELCRTGVLEPSRSGRFVIYRLHRPVLRDLAAYVAGLAGLAGTAHRRRGDASARRRDREATGLAQLSMFADRPEPT